MRFSKHPWPNPSRGTREWTAKRLQAARRAVKKEIESVGLFPELAVYKTVEDRQRYIDVEEAHRGRTIRDGQAQMWRDARRRLRQLPPITRQGVLRYWRQWNGPLSAVYLLTHIEDAERGKSPWSKLRELRQMKLVGEGRLPRELFFKRKL